MVDVVPEEAVHEQEHRYISNGHHVGLLTLYNQYMTEASSFSFVRSDSADHTQWLAYPRGGSSDLFHSAQQSTSLVSNRGPSNSPRLHLPHRPSPGIHSASSFLSSLACCRPISSLTSRQSDPLSRSARPQILFWMSQALVLVLNRSSHEFCTGSSS